MGSFNCDGINCGVIKLHMGRKVDTDRVSICRFSVSLSVQRMYTSFGVVDKNLKTTLSLGCYYFLVIVIIVVSFSSDN